MLSRSRLQGENQDTNLCTQILYNAWAMCDNNGRGGILPIEAGCLKYSLLPENQWPGDPVPIPAGAGQGQNYYSKNPSGA